MNIDLSRAKTIVVKIGTSLLTGPTGFDGRVLEEIVKELCRLKRERNLNLLVVSSGAVGCGMAALGMTERPKRLPLKQATAAVGQANLMHYYETLFRTYGEGLRSAQVLLSASDLDNRGSYLNIRNTLHTLFALNSVIPIINENDSVSIEELKFGDNDTLAARVAAKIGADLLIILSNVDGLYDSDPRRNSEARLIAEVNTITPELEAAAGDTGDQTSVGGMVTKLVAARIASAAQVRTVIANGRRPNIIHDTLAGQGVGTTFYSSRDSLSQRKRWIAFGRAARGLIRVDDGARNALLKQGRSLLAAGITGVEGRFRMGDAVRVTDAENHDIARGLVNYSSEDIERIKGCKSTQIDAILGQKHFDEVIHRNNMVVL
ncbi:MAG TPA: glutamate 5-kinase [Candidatus Hydrogenedentes bacterium]|nr:glutamate 5-kinase [Candidatus Hydrogenedentota bacterium]